MWGFCMLAPVRQNFLVCTGPYSSDQMETTGVVQCQFALGRCPSVHRDYLPIVSIFTTTYQEQKQVQSEPE
jgi:hypothetical protein